MKKNALEALFDFINVDPLHNWALLHRENLLGYVKLAI